MLATSIVDEQSMYSTTYIAMRNKSATALAHRFAVVGAWIFLVGLLGVVPTATASESLAHSSIFTARCPPPGAKIRMSCSSQRRLPSPAPRHRHGTPTFSIRFDRFLFVVDALS